MSFLVDMLRNAAAGALDAKQLERTLIEVSRLEKELARLTADKERLEAKVAELEAKMPPENFIDAGSFFFKKLSDDSIDDLPYCNRCKTPMIPHFAPRGPEPDYFVCADTKCDFALPYVDIVHIFKRHKMNGPRFFT